jgi:predicted transcriptional regulator
MATPGPNPTVTDERILRAIRDVYSPAAGTSEIAERVGLTRQATENRLRQLVERELVETRLIGQVRVWWLSTDGRRYIDDAH